MVTGTSSPAPAPGRAPGPATDPRATVWATGQKLQGPEIDIRVSGAEPTTQPTFDSTQPVNYTVSMDVYIEKSTTGTRSLLENNVDPEWCNPTPCPGARRPLLYLAGTSAPWTNGTSNICYEHSNSQNALRGTCSMGATNTPIGSYFNLTVTTDSTTKKLTIYRNGTKVGEGAVPDSFAWPAATGKWVFNHPAYAVNHTAQSGSLKVKNVYFWPKVLSDSDISKLTTSTYMPEPLTTGTSAYTKEMYMPY